jgi:hypothetical protein
MTYKQIEASREARLWLSQIIIPAAGVVVGLMTIPEVRQATSEKYKDVKASIKKKFKKH